MVMGHYEAFDLTEILQEVIDIHFHQVESQD